eukprot:CAMPEP_0114535194 /NCGR_PEP_ID=MMETSP0109-20121206/28282_1 /TAXON_ID=29199 /ORGANISM="Chlorarachnion reptans, Strain CCCM449" /LENGTH=1182 /DNA_ID=CAMNT_0001718735 /DNA_START=288 /DNA_END=3832 /DNA_ORIENTATION=-
MKLSGGSGRENLAGLSSPGLDISKDYADDGAVDSARRHHKLETRMRIAREIQKAFHAKPHRVSQLLLAESKVLPGQPGFFAPKFIQAGECFSVISLSEGAVSLNSKDLNDRPEFNKLCEILKEKLASRTDHLERRDILNLAYILFVLRSIHSEDSSNNLISRLIQESWVGSLPFRTILWSKFTKALCKGTPLAQALTKEESKFQHILFTYKTLCEAESSMNHQSFLGGYIYRNEKRETYTENYLRWASAMVDNEDLLHPFLSMFPVSSVFSIDTNNNKARFGQFRAGLAEVRDSEEGSELVIRCPSHSESTAPMFQKEFSSQDVESQMGHRVYESNIVHGGLQMRTGRSRNSGSPEQILLSYLDKSLVGLSAVNVYVCFHMNESMLLSSFPHRLEDFKDGVLERLKGGGCYLPPLKLDQAQSLEINGREGNRTTQRIVICGPFGIPCMSETEMESEPHLSCESVPSQLLHCLAVRASVRERYFRDKEGFGPLTNACEQSQIEDLLGNVQCEVRELNSLLDSNSDILKRRSTEALESRDSLGVGYTRKVIACYLRARKETAQRAAKALEVYTKSTSKLKETLELYFERVGDRLPGASCTMRSIPLERKLGPLNHAGKRSATQWHFPKASANLNRKHQIGNSTGDVRVEMRSDPLSVMGKRFEQERLKNGWSDRVFTKACFERIKTISRMGQSYLPILRSREGKETKRSYKKLADIAQDVAERFWIRKYDGGAGVSEDESMEPDEVDMDLGARISECMDIAEVCLQRIALSGTPEIKSQNNPFTLEMVPDSWRLFYTDTIFVQSLLHLLVHLIIMRYENDWDHEAEFKSLQSGLHLLDLALHMSPNKNLNYDVLVPMCSAIHDRLVAIRSPVKIKSRPPNEPQRNITENTYLKSLDSLWKGNGVPVDRVSWKQFQEWKLDLRSEPVVIFNALEEWPAMSNWKSKMPSSFLEKSAYRHAPVETGGLYTSTGAASKMMRIVDFFKECYSNNPNAHHENAIFGNAKEHHSSSTKKGRTLQEGDNASQKRSACSPTFPNANSPPPPYLAQYPIFDVIPSLKSDISPYLTISKTPNGSVHQNDLQRRKPHTINIWIGPNETVSPLHVDQKDNLLCQVSGVKYIRLYPPEESLKLYPRKGSMNNTSQVDLTAIDTLKFPSFARARFTEVLLRAGDVLYIPKGYWHFVKAL